MTEDQPKPKKERSDKQKANDAKNSAKFKALWATNGSKTSSNGSETKVSETHSETHSKPSETRSEPKKEVSETPSKTSSSSPETGSETEHPGIPPPREAPKETVPSPPKKKPFRMIHIYRKGTQ